MKIKIISLIMFLLLLTSCNISYEIEIKEDKTYNETLTINNIKTNLYSHKDIKKNFYEKLPNYKITIPDYDVNNIKASITNQKLMMLKHSEIMKYAYFDESNNIYEIKLSPNIEMLDSIFYDLANDDKPTNTNIKVSIKLPFEVLETNATEVKDNTYIWQINKNNYKNIILEFSNKLKKTEKQKKKEEIINIIVISFLIIGLITFLITTYIKYKNRNSNIK